MKKKSGAIPAIFLAIHIDWCCRRLAFASTAHRHYHPAGAAKNAKCGTDSRPADEFVSPFSKLLFC
jgi:hypothetical protein